MLKIVVNQTDEDITYYKEGQELAPFICDCCGQKKLIKFCDIEPDRAVCAQCRGKQDRR